MTQSSEPTVARPEQIPSAGPPVHDQQGALPVHDPPRAASTSSAAWDQATKRTVVVILLVVMALVLWFSRPVIPLLVIAGVMAYFLSPIVDLPERIRIPRTISTIVHYLILLVALILTPILLIPILGAQLASLNFDVPSTAFRFFTWVGETVNNLPDTVEFLGFEIQVSGLIDQIEESYREFTF